MQRYGRTLHSQIHLVCLSVSSPDGGSIRPTSTARAAKAASVVLAGPSGKISVADEVGCMLETVSG